MAQAACLTESHDILIKRPPTNYEQHWDYEFFKILKNEYKSEAYVKEAAALRDEVRHLLDHLYVQKDPIALLEFIEDIQRLGLGYVFKDDIRQVLHFLVENDAENSVQKKGSLYATALYFRLFRQHGFIVSQEVFNVFKDPQGCFMQDLGQDIHGILSLYEASHLAAQGEKLLDEAKTFARRLLLDIKQDIDPNLANQVTRALGLPLHYNIARLEARWYIDAYSKRKDANANLLRYAKLEYNMLQGTYREELAIVAEWDLNEVEQLPEYMKLLFFAFYNTINGFAYHAMKEQGVNILLYLRKKAMDNIKAYLVELNWVKTGYVPSFKEYMEVACASSTVALIYYYSYVFMSPKISVETLDYMDSDPDIIHWSNFILRLIDDLKTYQDEFERGDTVKAIECYMNDKGVTEEAAQIYIHDLAQETWKKLNAELLVNSTLPNATTMMILNTNRAAQVFYQYGDGYGHPDREMKKRFSNLVFDNIPM